MSFEGTVRKSRGARYVWSVGKVNLKEGVGKRKSRQMRWVVKVDNRGDSRCRDWEIALKRYVDTLTLMYVLYVLYVEHGRFNPRFGWCSQVGGTCDAARPVGKSRYLRLVLKMPSKIPGYQLNSGSIFLSTPGCVSSQDNRECVGSLNESLLL